MITNYTVLQFYNPNLPTKITVDDSKHGFEPTREQNHNGKLLSFHLPHVQNKTSSIESEILSFVFISKKFIQFIYGTHFIIKNNQKSLKQMQNFLTNSPLRIQRFMLAQQH